MDLLQLFREIGLDPKRVSATHGGEYHSSCPACGGHDRCYIQPNRQMKNCIGYYKCRQCQVRGDTIQFYVDFLSVPFKEIAKKLNISHRRSLLSTVDNKTFVTPILHAPSEKWLKRANDCVAWAHKMIWNHPAQIQWLTKRGIPEEAIKNYGIGFCDRKITLSGSEFEIDDKPEIKIPIGIVIPTTEPSGQVIRIKIRREGWYKDAKFPKYWAMPGSMNGLNIVGNTQKPIMMIVESEFDALALHHVCSDLLFVVAVGSNTKNPDIVTDYWAKRRKVLICHDNDEGGIAMLTKWQKLYPASEACPTPVGKDIGEAIQQGLDIREWVLEILK